MTVAIGTIATDLSTSVPGLQKTVTLFTLHHGVVDDSREHAVRHLGPHKCFTAGLIGYGAGATLAQPRPDDRRVLAPRGCGFGVDDPTGVHPDHRRLRRRKDPGEVLGEDPDVVHDVS